MPSVFWESCGAAARAARGSSTLRAMRQSQHAVGRLAAALFFAATVFSAAEDCGAAVSPPEGVARIHYHRPDAAYAGYGLHVWEHTTAATAWTSPLAPAGNDDFGLYWDVPLTPGAEKLGFIVHKGDLKDPGPDMFLLPAEHGVEVWVVSGRATLFTTRPDVSVFAFGDLTAARAHWLARDLIAWPAVPRPGDLFRLHGAPVGGLVPAAEGVLGGESFLLTVDPEGLPAEEISLRPHLRGCAALRLGAAGASRAEELLKGQVLVSVSEANGTLREATGVQIPGVLDALFATDIPLGPSWVAGAPTLRLWAPTARSVTLLLFAGPRDDAPLRSLPMTEERGLWTAAGDPSWKGQWYLYEVAVFVPETGRVERNRVTDPYSRGLARNSVKSLLVDLDDPVLVPQGWNSLRKPPLAAPEDIVLYELHIRDFSAGEPELPEPLRGTYEAFTRDTHGTRHLRSLAEAGLTHVHLLPAFDLATIGEDRSAWKTPGDLSGFPPDGEEQQAAVARIAGEDGYNWGYDPWHYGVPEGSYATDPDGPARTLEFRRMVQALAGMGLRVVMDVVYNHTHSAGQDPQSVLDRIVPGYYHRLNADGRVETSTCCANTATEHRMMERLMVDDLVHWARDYKVDGFRFDLMGHHMKRNMERARDALHALTPEKDAVEGSAIHLYGEGWDFGEVGQGKRGVNAVQAAMAGTGIGTFNDRLRDAVRGGSPFNDRREQGFTTGLYTSPGEFNRGGEVERLRLLEQADRIRAGLAGNIRGYRFVARGGAEAPASAQGAYALDPQETINYASAHDNETLFDKIAFAAPAALGTAERARMQTLALSLVALGQGVPFFHAGCELLRSKSLDADSYNSGDWFNALDFSGARNNFGVGLPPAGKNRDRWAIMRPLLARADLVPGPEEIRGAADRFRELLAVRRSSPLFRLRSAEEIAARLVFLNTGPMQIPGLIVMTLADEGEGRADLDPAWARLVVLFNARPEAVTFGNPAWRGAEFRLHPVLAASADPAVPGAAFSPVQGAFRVPARSTAVFVEPVPSH